MTLWSLITSWFARETEDGPKFSVSKQSTQRNLWIRIPFLILLFTMLFRWARILPSVSFDFDEVFILRLMEGRPWEFFTGRLFDPGTPPLGLFLLEMWKGIVGSSESMLKLLPIGIYVLSFILFAVLASRILRPLAAAGTLMLFAGNGVLWYYGMYLKPYALLLFLSLATILLAHTWCVPATTHRDTKKEALTVLVITAGLYTHYSYLVFLFVLALAACIASPNRKQTIRNLLQPIPVSLLLFMPWIVVFFKQQIIPTAAGNRYFFHQILEGWIDFDGWLSVLTNGLSERLINSGLERLLGVSLTMMFLLFGSSLVSKIKHPMRKTIFLTTLTSTFLLLFTPLHNVLTEARYWIFLFPLLFLSIGTIVEYCEADKIFAGFTLRAPETLMGSRFLPGSRGKLKTVKNFPSASSILVAISLLLFFFTPFFANTQFSDWKGLAARIPLTQNNAVILFDPCHLGYVFTYYYHGDIPVACMAKKPEGLPYPIWDKTPAKTLYIIKNTNNNGFEEQLYYELLNTYSEHKYTFDNTQLIIMNN